MPTYEYKCDACGHAFERFQPMSAAPVKKCPECGKSKVKRLIGTGAGLIFKGSGFYITDYRDSSYGDKAKADKGESTSGTPTESKPAATGGESSPTPAAPAASGGESAAPKSAETKKPTPKAEPKPAAKSSSANASKK